MSKSPYDLEEDIKNVLTTGEGYTKEIASWVGTLVAESLLDQLEPVGENRKGNLRLSNIGTPCKRKLWYTVNSNDVGEPLSASAKNKFIYGDLTEAHVLGLAKAAGHDVRGLQTQLDVHGIRGHRDCVIDGMLFDVKSTSTRGFDKFSGNGLRVDDPFGYISQLSSYLYGSKDDPLVTYKRHAGFIAVEKQFGNISVDIYDLTEELNDKESEIAAVRKATNRSTPPPREFDEVPFGKSGNMKLGTMCSYCDYKFSCWPNVRKFIYSSGPVYLTKVDKVPNVPEVE